MNKKLLEFKNFKKWGGHLLIAIMLLASPFTLSASGTSVAQLLGKKISVKIENSSIESILVAICKEANLKYMADSHIELGGSNTYSLTVVNESAKHALDMLFNNTSYTYEAQNGGIVIVERPEPIKIAQPTEPQKLSINGIVLDNKREPIAGATVILVGTNDGSITDSEGKFMLSAPIGSKIAVSCVGFVEQEVELTGTNPVIVLEVDAMQVDEVVVNGVFTRKANTFTGAVTTLTKEELKRVGNSNVMQALKNLDPSIMFIDNMEFGSDPNSMPEMFLRGKSSISIEDTDLRATYQSDPNAPLFILDGFEVSLQTIMDLDMNRVESMTILKDAGAKAIYGSKAANGVIVIETKRNTDGSLRVTYDGSVEIQAPDLSSYNLTNAAEKLDVELANGMFTDSNGNETLELNRLYNQKRTFVESGIDTDWLSKPLQLGVGTKHGISLELGDGALRSVINLSYNNVKGVMKGSDRTNLSGAINLTYRHQKFMFRNQLTITNNVSNDSAYGSFSEYASLNPYYTPYDSEGNVLQNIIPIIEGFSGQSVTVADWYGDINYEANPLYNAELNTMLRNTYFEVTNNFETEYNVLNNLKLIATIGITENNSRRDTFYPSDHLKFSNYSGDDALRKGSYSLQNGNMSNLSGRFTISYNKEILPGHYLYTNAGADMSSRQSLTNIVNAEGFPSEYMTDIMFARQYVENSKPTGTEATTRDVGYFLSANYSYDERINLDATFRQNASSMYGADSRWGAFWSTGISWNIHNEDWIDKSIFSNLRVRASIGSTGSQSSAAYNAIATYSYFLDRDYGGLVGTQLMSMENPDLQWQQKNDLNFGLDLNIMGRFSLTFDAYRSVTNNAVNPLTLAPSTGFSSVNENVGSIKNIGIDARISYTVWQRPNDRAFFSVFAAASHNKNTLQDISDAMKAYNDEQNVLASSGVDENGNPVIAPLSKFYDGVSMDAIWAMQSLGIDPANGNELFLAVDGNGNSYKTYNYNGSQQVICGDALPKINGNVGFNFEYKGVSLSATCTYKWGGQMYNSTLVSKVENANMKGNVDRRIYTDRWREAGDISPYKKIQKVTYTDASNMRIAEQTGPTSRFVQDRNELSIASIRIGYDFYNFAFVEKLGVERIRLAINMNDVAVLSTIKVERGTAYPFARTFNGSLSITF